MMIREGIHSDLAIPPGEYLEEIIAEMGMTKDELARRMNRPAPKLSAIFKGQKAITPDTALQLEKVVGVPAHIWTGLEAEYRLTLARNQEVRETQKLRDETHLIRKFCYSELAKLGFVARKTKPVEKVLELQRFFGVTSLKNISTL
ncbi:MAG: addiction module antidote protein, HigA family, partial [Calditrichaeota bacterium]